MKLLLVTLLTSATAFLPPAYLSKSSALFTNEIDRRDAVKIGTSAAAGAALTVLAPDQAEAALSTQWTQVQIPFTDTLYDLDFDTKDHVSF
jgi:hypothetical protein